MKNPRTILSLNCKPLVYMAVNRINGKMYFGITRRGFENRKKEHIRTARQGYKSVLCSALRKYGPEEFAFIVVSEFDDYQDAIRKEIELIAKYKPAYNVAPGGEGSNYWLGKKRDQETNVKISRTKTGVPRGYTPPHVLEVFKENMRRAARARRKPVKCLDDGLIFESAAAASKHYGFDPTAVAAVCARQKGRQAVYGRRFEYIQEVVS